ncbi:hypothetical protein X875_20120 [Mannheimia varigena USDA-ARS-USMARC-1388]|uniref:Uncharacterized protein n=1 Tax=Mannheimia varigena USDA-ARS-USMARC-1296 TaxID=1433287 RepID=W0Q8J5_9PAST|nr:hypothetical protein [Mannheimia varigena]AHG74622.1 hypothetical protein X808_950 [Mannheimia varigena USDA-ARS-USMARC-1296]AHG80626.1 hypothetical protein X875_20120 [Mannheimia varigena USDA-ARS-USMARC-1388]QLB17324.1 hypothetical protein A6B40_06905 [Mannheimia varigena]
MEDLKLTEKELLIMKGNALRMRFKAETKKTKNDIVQPFKQARNTGLSLISSPVATTAVLEFMLKKFLKTKGVGYSALGLVALFLLKQKQNRR